MIERYMYAENVQLKPSRYPGHGPELADGPENVMAFFNRLHQESVAIFSRLSADDLQKKCVTPGGAPITVWKWLRAMVEHESITAPRFMFTWACWAFPRRRFTG